MNSTIVRNSAQALLFMRRCRQAGRLPIPSHHVRHASQVHPLPSAASPNPLLRGTVPATSKPRSKGVFSEGRSPTEVRVETNGPSIWTAIRTVLGFKPKPASDYIPAPFTATTNPYRARKKWPPNFKNLHPKHQFHYEKTYRRRMKLKYARPRWMKATKLVQWTLIYGVLFYWIFFLEMGEDGADGTPFDNLREWGSEKWQNLGKLPDNTEQEVEKIASREKFASPKSPAAGGR